MRVLGLGLLPARADEDLGGRERQTRVDQAAPDVSGALAPLLQRSVLAAFILTLGKRLHEPPDCVAGETDRKQHEQNRSPRVLRECLQRTLTTRRPAAAIRGDADREDPNDPKRDTLCDEAAPSEPRIPAAPGVGLRSRLLRRVLDRLLSSSSRPRRLRGRHPPPPRSVSVQTAQSRLRIPRRLRTTGGHWARDRGSTDERSSDWLVDPICWERTPERTRTNFDRCHCCRSEPASGDSTFAHPSLRLSRHPLQSPHPISTSATTSPIGCVASISCVQVAQGLTVNSWSARNHEVTRKPSSRRGQRADPGRDSPTSRDAFRGFPALSASFQERTSG